MPSFELPLPPHPFTPTSPATPRNVPGQTPSARAACPRFLPPTQSQSSPLLPSANILPPGAARTSAASREDHWHESGSPPPPGSPPSGEDCLACPHYTIGRLR